MTTTLQNFASETQLTAIELELLSTSTSESKFIGKFTLTNTSDSNVEVTLWRIGASVPGTSGSGGNWIYRETVPAGKPVTVDKMQGHVLGPSMKISGLSATASVINVDISGTLET